MDVTALLAEYRRRADDIKTVPRTDDATLTGFLAEGEDEAAVRSDCIYDDSSDFTTLAITAGTATWPIDPRILRVTAATFQPTGYTYAQPLRLRGIDWIEDENRYFHDCRPLVEPCPGTLVERFDNQVVLFRTPSLDGTLQLSVRRRPLFPLEATDDEPEIPENQHIGLVDWCLWRALNCKDGEEGDTKLAASYYAAFEARFGPRKTLEQIRRQRERRRVTCRMEM